MRILRISALLLLLLALNPRLFAQAGATGTILGTVTDPSGAVVPNAKINVTNTATKITFQTVTNSAGDFNAPALNPGTYTVSGEARGFQKVVISSFTLTVNQPPTIASGNSTTFQSGSPGSFSVTTAGLPAASLSVTGSLPH